MEESIISIDVSMVNNKKELHQLLKGKLDFPDFYGENWAAFWDAITGLVELPDKLEFIGWHQFAKRLPSTSAELKRLLKKYHKAHKKFPHLQCEVIYK